MKKKLLGRWRLLFGNCPKCNSDAPAMYDCNICDFKENYHGRKKSEDRKYWWNRFIGIIAIEKQREKMRDKNTYYPEIRKP